MACMIDSRDPYCPELEPGETIVLVIRPETSSGKSRPRRALLQFDAVVREGVYRVDGRRRSFFERKSGVNDVTPSIFSRTAYLGNREQH